jgi:hypothetical protein
MNKRYALIENGIVVNIIAAVEDPSYMTDLLSIEVDDTVQIDYLYDGINFIENESTDNNTIIITD